MRLVALIFLFLMPGIALANNASEIVQVIGYVVSIFYPVAGFLIMAAGGVYGADQARKRAGELREQQRRAYNDSLRDRTITRIATNAPFRYVYGHNVRVGSDIVALFSSGSRDEYKHIVCVHAAHQSESIDEVWLNSKPIGALDGNGDVTGGEFMHTTIGSVDSEAHTGTSWTLAHTPVPGSLRVVYGTMVSTSDGMQMEYTAVPFTLTGAGVVVETSRDYFCHYDYVIEYPRVRVTKHLGSPTDPADAQLVALLPGRWTANSLLRGFTYTVIRLDLNHQEFQGGLPSIEVKMNGKLLHDPRDPAFPNDAPLCSSNPALVSADYLMSEMCGVPYTDLPLADYQTAANVCDETITIAGASVAKYTFNGTISADQEPPKMLEGIAASMAGGIVGTSWSCWAGKYVAPVMALSESDIVGSFTFVAGTPGADLYNGVRGQYISAEMGYVVTDFVPYQNATYVVADQREDWNNIDYPFTDSVQRVHNLARIAVEDQRNGFTIKAVFSLKAWVLKPGNRITFTSALLGQSSKVYRVTDKRFGADMGVELTLKEDAASIWDLADAVAVDETPNTNLPNPLTVGLCGNVQMVENIYETTGSAGVRSKATLSWTAPADVTAIDYEVEYKPYTSGTWAELTNVRGTSYAFIDLAPGNYDFRVKARNVLGFVGEYTAIKSFTVYGLLAAPAMPTNFSVAAMSGMGLAVWDKTTDQDVKIGGKAVVRFCPLTTGASWEQSIVVEEFNGDAVNGIVPLASGTYYAKFVDSTGHYSDTAASFVATEALVTGWATVATSTQHTTFAGVKTNVAALDGALRLDSLETIGAQVNLMSTWGMIGSLGGINSSGEYAFDTRLDLGSKAARRFHASLKTLAYDVGDRIGLRGLVSTWPSIGGSVVNDCDVTVLASVSDDDIVYGPWTPFMVADFNCRYADFKVQLASGFSTHNIKLSELSVSVKEPV